MIKIKDKYPCLPISILKLDRNKEERILRSERKTSNSDKYYTESSRKTKSYFDPKIAEFILKYYARECKVILDPFAGWGERNYYAAKLGYEYIGFDISKEAIKHAEENFDVINNLANSKNLPLRNNSIDFCYSCPPYWNLEKYENTDGQLSDKKNYIDFLTSYYDIIREIERCLKKNSLCIFVVGDFRKKGKLYDFSTDTIRLFTNNCNFELFDKIIIDKSINYRIPMFLQQADRLGYVVKLHEYILVFKKI